MSNLAERNEKGLFWYKGLAKVSKVYTWIFLIGVWNSMPNFTLPKNVAEVFTKRHDSYVFEDILDRNTYE